MKHNKEDIIKAIECHKINNCCKCPYEGLPNCIDALCNNTVEFIKELTEECEILTKALDSKCDECIARERAGTVKKMHSEIKDRCIKGGIYPAFVATTIDQIAKEMIEECGNTMQQR